MRWRIRLFDGPALVDPEGYEIRRFRSSKCAAILAYLALRLGRACSREELYEAIWPEEPPDRVANRFRVALSSLRKQLEPDGVAPGSVLDAAERGRLRLRAETVWTDTAEVDALLRQGRCAEALRLIHGELLPGNYEEWAVSAREYYEAALQELLEAARSVPAMSARTAEPSPNSSNRVPSPDPPLSPAWAPPLKQLPFYLTRFFGREQERRELAALLQEHRLVTVTGPGGVGKSRIATETLRNHPANAFFVPLADLTAGDRLAERALNALSIAPAGEGSAVEILAAWLERKGPAVLALDNAEYLVEPVAELALALLRRVEGLRILVTSRRRLELPGEVCLPLYPLPFPKQSPGRPSDDGPAVALFVDRARSSRPGFAMGPRQAVLVSEICGRLEGLPLAIELAAARLGVQSLPDVARELSATLMELRSGQRHIPPRHRSLRAAIQGSVEALPPDTRAVLARLSVFRDGWTEAAAAFVVGIPDAREHLEILMNASLASGREDPDTGQMRFSFLESIREYASEQLSPDERAGAIQRHAAYFLRLAGDVDQDDLRTIHPLDAEQENIALALAASPENRAEEFWRGLAGATVHAFVRGRHRVAVRWLEPALGRLGEIASPNLRSNVTYAAFLILSETGRREEASRLVEATETEANRSGCLSVRAHALSMRGFLREIAGDHAAASSLQLEALEIARELEDEPLLLHCLSHASGALHNQGSRLGAGTAAGREALARAEVLARELCGIVPERSRRLPLARLLLAAAVFYQGRMSEAAALLRDTADHALRLGTRTELMYAAAFASEIALRNGETEQAALLYGAFDEIRDRLGFSDERLSSFNNGWHDDFLNRLQEARDPDTLSALLERGKTTPIDQLLRSVA